MPTAAIPTSIPLRPPRLLLKERAIAGDFGTAWKRFRGTVDIDWARFEAAAIIIIADGGSVADAAEVLFDLAERAVDWRRVFPGVWGRLLEEAENPALRLGARRGARLLMREWRALSRDARTAWAADLLEQLAAARSADELPATELEEDGEDENGAESLAIEPGPYTDDDDDEDGEPDEPDGDGPTPAL